MKRSGKFYRKNESEVMRDLGFEPTPNSGSGWVIKEDGQNENGICQLKSTDAKSIKVDLQDLHTLEYNASVTKKIPVFAVQFLRTNETWLMVKPDMIQDVADFIKTGVVDNSLFTIDLEDTEDLYVEPQRVVKSSSSARDKFRKENDDKFRRKEKSAR